MSQTIDTDDDNAEFLVVDSDDYQQTKNLEAIFKAKKQVRQLAQDPEWIERNSSEAKIQYNKKLCYAVCYYGSELLPLIEEATENEIISEDITQLSWGEIQAYITSNGHIPKNKDKDEWTRAKPFQSMAVYRQLRRIERELGLGIKIEKKTEPAQI
jgi:hypothetical protein